jgi:hypothetical protein
MDEDAFQGGVFTQESPIPVRENPIPVRREKQVPAKIGISPDGIPFFVTASGEVEGFRRGKKRKKKKKSCKRKKNEKVEGMIDFRFLD